MRSMVLLSLRNMASNRLRFLLTTFAVLLGVSFVVASFVMTDGLRATFDNIVTDANADVDLEVRARSNFDEVQFSQNPIDETLVDTVASVEGVERADPGTQSMKIVPVRSDGEPVTTGGAPILSFNWEDSPGGALDLVAGKIPDGPAQFALDVTTADREGFVVGGTYDIIGATGREPFELVGISSFGEENALAGAIMLTFELDELQRLDDSEGQIQWISVTAAQGVDIDELVRNVEAALPASAEAVTNEEVVAEAKDEISGIIDIFGNILLAFALVTVFVSTFIIANTFNILLGQRVRQLSLLRALGASSRQIRFGAMFEALIVGLVASLLGLGGGVLLAVVLQAIMDSLGFGLPGLELIIRPQTVIAAVVVGVGVTLVAALSPARRAAGIPPMAGIRSGFRFGSGEGTRRTIIAIILAVIGAAAMGYGLFGGSDNTGLLLMILGLGAVLVFVAVSMFAPLFSTPSASALGLPLEHIPGRRITGHMARQNAASNNKRTATTAAGLMIGLALIAMATVVANSLKTSFRETLGSTLTADYLITAPNGGTFSNQIVGEIAALPDVGPISSVRYGTIRVGGGETAVTATDLTVLTELLAVGVVDGDPIASADPRHILMTEDHAADLGVSVGDQVAVEFAAAGRAFLEVGAIFSNDFLVEGGYLIDLTAWDAYFDSTADGVIAFSAAPGVDPAELAPAIDRAEAAFPQLIFETRDEFGERIEGQLDSFLIIINVFLGLAIVIALLGIANTMALAVLERTRELGLMRAIGMTRRQTRSLIRLEAGVVSLFGAILGVLVGVAFGWIAVIAIPDSFIDQVTIPVSTLAIYTVIATIAGLIAASFPARRAARLNILDAIAEL